MTAKNFLSPDAIEVVPRTSPPREALENSIFAQEKVCPPEYPRKVQFHIASLEALEGGPGRLNLNPSVSLSVGLLGSNSEPFTTDRVKCGSIVNWNSNTPVFFVHESSQIRFELNYHPALRKKSRSLGHITLSIPELLLRAPTGADRESFVEYRIPSASSESHSSSESDRGSQQKSQPINTGKDPLVKFSIRDLVATGAASDAFPGVKQPGSSIGDTAIC